MKYLACVCFLLFLMIAPARAADAARPNVVLIMADDLGIEGLSCYGGTSYRTPNLDAMARSGIQFTHAYSQPLCTPTRVQIMTGRYNHRNWVAFGILDPGERTFGHLMKAAGYETCIAGKWQLQSYDPPDFPNAARRRGLGMKVADAGFDEYSLFHSWETEDKGSRYGNPTFDRNGQLTTVTDGYGPDTSVDFILNFMKRHRDEPTFVYYPMSLPHWPMVPTPDSAAWSDPAKRLDESTEYFPDMVKYTDKAVGRIVEGIAALGLSQKTLILFYSDNGTDARIVSRLGDREVRGGKATPRQTGIRVPLIASWAGTIAAGQKSDCLIDASDFLPTLAELGGTRIPADWQHDGRSFAGVLRGTASESSRKACFFWYDPRPGWDKERFSRHVFALDRNYKLFSDGRLFDIKGTGLREELVPPEAMTAEATAAKKRLKSVIRRAMQPPISPPARQVVDAFGDPVEK